MNDASYFALALLVYLCTLLSAILFRKREAVVTLILFVLVCVMTPLHTRKQLAVAAASGVVFAATELLCIRYFDMWRYNVAAYAIPIWLPFAWTLVAFSIFDAARLLDLVLLVLPPS